MVMCEIGVVVLPYPGVKQIWPPQVIMGVVVYFTRKKGLHQYEDWCSSLDYRGSYGGIPSTLTSNFIYRGYNSWALYLSCFW